MLLIAALLAAAPTVTVIPARHPAGSLKPICRNPQMRYTAGASKPGVHPLGAEPPVQQIKAVVREIGGCNRPMVIADRVGASGR